MEKPILKLKPTLLKKSISLPTKKPSLSATNPRDLQIAKILKEEVNLEEKNLAWWLEKDELRDSHLNKNYAINSAQKKAGQVFVLLCENRLDGRKAFFKVILIRRILKERILKSRKIKDYRKMQEKIALKEIQSFSEFSLDSDLKEYLLEYQTSWTENGNYFLKLTQFGYFPMRTLDEWEIEKEDAERILSLLSRFLEKVHEKNWAILNITPESILYDGSKIKFLSLDYLQESVIPPNTEIQEPPTKHLPPELLKLPIDSSMDLKLCDLFLFGILAYWLFLRKYPNLENLDEEIGGISDENTRKRIMKLLKKEPSDRRLF